MNVINVRWCALGHVHEGAKRQLESLLSSVEKPITTMLSQAEVASAVDSLSREMLAHLEEEVKYQEGNHLQ